MSSSASILSNVFIWLRGEGEILQCCEVEKVTSGTSKKTSLRMPLNVPMYLCAHVSMCPCDLVDLIDIQSMFQSSLCISG